MHKELTPISITSKITHINVVATLGKALAQRRPRNEKRLSGSRTGYMGHSQGWHYRLGRATFPAFDQSLPPFRDKPSSEYRRCTLYWFVTQQIAGVFLRIWSSVSSHCPMHKATRFSELCGPFPNGDLQDTVPLFPLQNGSCLNSP